MTQAVSALTTMRHWCGDAYTLVRDRGFSVTRTLVFERKSTGLAIQPPVGVSFRFGNAGDLLSFTERTHDYGAAEKRFGFERLAQGDSLVVAEADGAIVFYGWLMYREMDLDQNVRVRVAPDAAYSYKLFTVPRARGFRICAGYYRFVESSLKPMGYRRLICRIAPGNLSSVRGHVRVGFEPCGTLWKFVAARHAFYFVDRGLRSWLPSITPSGHFTRAGFLQRYDQ